jgi:DNA-binding CsgD family transcriptional regulator
VSQKFTNTQRPHSNDKEIAMKPAPVTRVVNLCSGGARKAAAVPMTFPAAAVGRQPRKLRLTPRELEVLALLCEGLSNKLICRRLDICTGTVKCHVASILQALGVSSRLQAVIAAHRLGLLDAPPQDEADDGAPADDSFAAAVRPPFSERGIRIGA